MQRRSAYGREYIFVKHMRAIIKQDQCRGAHKNAHHRIPIRLASTG